MNRLVFDFFKNYLFSKRAGAVVKKISWLTTIGLFVSVSSLIVVISVMNALNQSIRKRTLALEPHMVIEFPMTGSFDLINTHPVAIKLRNDLGFEVQPFEAQDVILRTMDGHFRGAVARGVSETSYRRLLRELKLNDFENRDAEGPLQGEVDMGSELARSLGVFEGDSIMVVPPEGLLLPPSEAPPLERVRVRKILNTNLADVDSQNIFYKKGYTLNTIRRSVSRKVGLEVWLPDPDLVQEIKQDLSSFSELKIETWKEKNSAMFFALRLEKSVITLFLSMAALIAGFSLLSVLALLTSQKRREIGLLQAIGMSRRQVQNLFAQMGYGLALIGVGGGLVVGLGLSFYLQFYPLNVLPEIYYDSSIPAKVDLGFVLIVVVVAMILSGLGSWYSAQFALEDSPSESLRAKN